MNNLQINIENYLEYCRTQKRLDSKTIKAYCIDLHQFSEQIWITEASELTVPLLETYIAKLHQQYAPKTVKRKIASLKALFHHLEYKEIILHNPFAKLQLRFREPIILPKTIPLTILKWYDIPRATDQTTADRYICNIGQLVFGNIQKSCQFFPVCTCLIQKNQKLTVCQHQSCSVRFQKFLNILG